MTRDNHTRLLPLVLGVTMALLLGLMPMAAAADDAPGTTMAPMPEATEVVEAHSATDKELGDGQTAQVNQADDDAEPTVSEGEMDDAAASVVLSAASERSDQDELEAATALEGEGAQGESEDDPGTPEPRPLPAKAQTVSTGVYVIESNVSDEKVLDAAGKTPSATSNVASWSYNGGANQQWELVAAEGAEGWYHLFLAGSNRSLALSVAPSSSNASNVGLAKVDDAGDAALWAFVKNGSWYNLYNRETGLWLEVEGGSTDNKANVQVAEKNTSNQKQQRFFLLAVNPSVSASDAVTEGAYRVSPSLNAALAAEVRGAKTDEGTNIWLYTANDKMHQTFYFEKTSDGYYLVWVVGTERLMAQESTAIIPGTNVVQKAYASGDDTQLWALRTYADNTCSLVNKATGLALGAKGNKSGSNLAVTRNDGYKTTKFTLTRKALLSAGIKEIHPRTSASVSLDIQRAAASGNANLLLWTDTDALNQRFELVAAGGTDLWRIRTASSGGWITDTGAAIQQAGSGSTAKDDANTWRVTFKGGGYCLVNKASGKAMDMRYGKTDKGTSIIRYAPNGKDSQHFTFTSATLLTPGCHFIKSRLGTYLDVAGNSAAAGANVQTWAKETAVGQFFTIERSGTHYRIKNTYSGKYLTAADTANGSNVSQENSSNSNAQQWDAVIADGGYVGFKGVASGKALDVKRNSTKNGANVQIYKANQGDGQAWKPIKTEYQPYSGYVLRAVNKANASRSSTKYLLVVDKSVCKVICMEGGNGTWRPKRIMSCSVGKASTPTVEGSFVVQERGLSFGEDGFTCWYWTQFYGDYLFHSVLYNEGSKTSIQDGRLGMHISHGCVRMPLDDAYWIYSNVPRGTRVLIYT